MARRRDPPLRCANNPAGLLDHVPTDAKASSLAPLAWCIYPLIYIAYALARGQLLGSYPYHFIDVTSLGYSKVLLNSLGLLAVFGVLGGAVYGIARLQTRAASTAPPPR